MEKVQKRNGQSGFTLIELIAVIVILGILASVAVPRFMDIQVDARQATINGVAGNLKSAASLVYAKSALEGLNNADTGDVTVEGQTISIAYGYPDSASDLEAAMRDLDGVTLDGNAFQLDDAPDPGNCQVTYNSPSSEGDSADFTVTDTCD